MRIISGSASKGGHYSPGIVSHGTLYISGQLPIDHNTGRLVPGGIAEQTKKALRNMDRILAAAGLVKKRWYCAVYISPISAFGMKYTGYMRIFSESISLPVLSSRLENSIMEHW